MQANRHASSKKKLKREGERERGDFGKGGSYNVPQYIVTLLRPESVAKHSIKTEFLFSIFISLDFIKKLKREEERERERGDFGKGGSYNVPQYIVSLLRPESVAKHSI